MLAWKVVGDFEGFARRLDVELKGGDFAVVEWSGERFAGEESMKVMKTVEECKELIQTKD
jgi:hypothetical protein